MSSISCVVCNIPKVKLCPLSGNKARENNYFDKLCQFVGQHLSRGILEKHFVCNSCITLLDNFLLYKNNIVKLCTGHEGDLKRPAKTPPSALRQSVADQIISSVEKLKTLSIRSRKRICFSDHDYSKKSMSSSVSVDESTLDPTLFVTESEVSKKIDQELSSCVNDTVLFNFKDVDSLCEKHIFHIVINEMQKKCPSFFTALNSAISKQESSERRFATIATIYGMVMHSRYNKASAIQKIYSSLAIRYHADNELMSRLNKVHLMMSSESKRNIIAEFGDSLQEKLIVDISSGKTGKLNGDNVDIKVNTNDVRMSNKDKSYHFFASDFILDRVDAAVAPRIPTSYGTEPNVLNFLPSDQDTIGYKNNLKVLLSRVMLKYIPGFSWMEKLSNLPLHIPHPLEEQMAKKSIIHMLPVSLNNEVSYEGCIHIMDEYVEMLNHWYTKAGRGSELDSLQVPVWGDQLTRCRLQGAKSLRAGAHTPKERYEQLHPIVVELFHTLQDFLEKLCRKFLKLKHGRNVATLAHLKYVIHRSNVNGEVKARFKAHEDFVTLAGEAYFLSFVMAKFGMSSLDELPKHALIPCNIRLLHKHNKEKVANLLLEEIVDDIFIPFESKSHTTCRLEMGNWSSEVECAPHDGKVKINVTVNNANLALVIPTATLQQGCAVKLAGISNPLSIKEKPPKPGFSSDGLQDYVRNFLQWYFIILQIQDAIHEGDVVRTNIILKYMIPFFYSHSSMSKYLTECIDFILKTEFTLPPNYSMRVRAGSFVNVHGGKGKNKAADMHKENEVKLLKDLIKGLGANKTESSIVSVSKAAPVVTAVLENFDKMLDVKVVHSSHKKRSSADDLNAIIQVLQNVCLWDSSRVRSLDGFKDMKSSPFASLDKGHLFLTIQRIITRLQRDLPDVGIEDSDMDSNEDSDTEL